MEYIERNGQLGHFLYSLEFDNSAFVRAQQSLVLRQESSLPVRAHVIFEIFPFAILFNESLVITLVGASLRLIMPGLIGERLISVQGGCVHSNRLVSYIYMVVIRNPPTISLPLIASAK